MSLSGMRMSALGYRTDVLGSAGTACLPACGCVCLQGTELRSCLCFSGASPTETRMFTGGLCTLLDQPDVQSASGAWGTAFTESFHVVDSNVATCKDRVVTPPALTSIQNAGAKYLKCLHILWGKLPYKYKVFWFCTNTTGFSLSK